MTTNASQIFLSKMLIKDRFRGFLPVVVDVETSGFDSNKNAMLELAGHIIGVNKDDILAPVKDFHYHILPFKNAVIDKSAIKFNDIKIDHPFRQALTEKQALKDFFDAIDNHINKTNCTRAILVGHNASFDLGFIQAGAKRYGLKSPFHKFSTLDTVSLSALVYGQTVLSKAIKQADINWQDTEAHSALYDASKTAALFCKIVNQIKH